MTQNLSKNICKNIWWFPRNAIPLQALKQEGGLVVNGLIR
jgi:hypothetical protein